MKKFLNIYTINSLYTTTNILNISITSVRSIIMYILRVCLTRLMKPPVPLLFGHTPRPTAPTPSYAYIMR